MIIALNSGDRGRLVKEGGLSRLINLNGTVHTFRDDLKLDRLTDIQGNWLQADYDAAGLLIRVTHSSGDQLQFAYSAAGRLVQLREPAGRVVTYTYDDTGQHLTSVTNAVGRTVQYIYEGETGSPADHALRSTVHPDGSARNFEYDSWGRLSAEHIGDDAERRDYAYDGNGCVSIREGGDAEAATVLCPDATNRVAGIRKPDGSVFTMEYDRNTGNPVRMTDSLGHVTELRQDLSTGVLRDPLGNETVMRMNPATGLPKEFVNARGSAIQYDYDEKRRPRRATFADGTFESYDYDGEGNAAHYTNRKGKPSPLNMTAREG